MMWTLRVEGRLFHSGLPHKGINSLELAMEAIKYMQTNFYKDFPAVKHTHTHTNTHYNIIFSLSIA